MKNPLIRLIERVYGGFFGSLARKRMGLQYHNHNGKCVLVDMKTKKTMLGPNGEARNGFFCSPKKVTLGSTGETRK